MEWLEDHWDDPEFRGRVFTVIWTVSYLMLFLGFAIMAYVLIVG